MSSPTQQDDLIEYDLDISSRQLAEWVQDARQRTLELIEDLTDDQLMGPRLAIVNPLLWEIGHQAWFQEKWVLRHAAGLPPIRTDADALYDSAAVAHDTRWDLALPSREKTYQYMRTVRDRVMERLLKNKPNPEEIYFVLLSVFHEDMHTEAITYTRQTLGYPAPRVSVPTPALAPAPTPTPIERARAGAGRKAGPNGPLPGDVQIPGRTFLLGATPDEPFVFDNEKWAHPIEIRSFAMARAPVTQEEFAAFVDEGGYQERKFWTEAGWRWLEQLRAEHPVYWQRETGGRWLRRDFDRWVPLEPHRPVIHVSWYEADAYCRWAGRRLPTEPEWELAAAGLAKRRFPWGNDSPTARHANLDWRSMGCVDVADFPEGDSTSGCRQMIGNVWEWTSSDLLPYPGFVVDPYKEYSAPWFGTHKVLRGGCWATRSRLLRNTWRNFYRPERRDVWAGFRTCAV